MLSPPSFISSTLASPLRVATPVAPSGETARWLRSVLASISGTVFTSFTSLPSIDRIEIEPAMRLAT